jgi:3-hydroxyisobutyrate dehydrogenase-like beta-hydroxyacid dehydrogenase
MCIGFRHSSLFRISILVLRPFFDISRLPARGFADSFDEEILASAQRLNAMFYPAHKKIGVIGLGIIGRGVTAHLRRKGFQVFVWNRTPRPVPNFVGSPAELAELCYYIQIFVSDDKALLETVERLREKLTPKHTVLAHSTVGPNSMHSAAEIVGACGARFVEAPFTGSKLAAEKGELIYYVAGNEDALRKARPILEASSKQIVEIGVIGRATAVKIATNIITAASVQAAAEAMALAQALGLPMEKFLKAMEANASHSTTLAMKIPKIIERDFDPHFSVKHMLKDMEIANQLGLSHSLDLGVTAAARDRLLEQMQSGQGDKDYSAIARKYFPETKPAGTPQMKDQHLQPIVASMSSVETTSVLEQPELHQGNHVVAAVEPPASGLRSEPPKEERRLRWGFLTQLVHRARQLRNRPEPVSSKEE